MRIQLALSILCVLAASTWADDRPKLHVNPQGMVTRLVDWPAQVPCRAGVWVVRDGWKTIRQAWDLKNLKHSAFGPSRTLTGAFEFADGSVSLRQTIEPGSLVYELTPSAAMDSTGVYWFLEVPVTVFGGGRVVVGGQELNLPPERPAEAHIGHAEASTFVVRSRDGEHKVTVRFPAALNVRVQDARVFGEERYQIYVVLTEKRLAPQEKLQLAVSIDSSFPRDHREVTLSVDPTSNQGEFDGFGGNFVYAIDDETTSLALESLKLTWARIGMELAQWEPVNDNDDANSLDAQRLASQDLPGSALRRRFELDRKLFEQAGGRMIASVWAPPKWLFADGQSKGRIDRSRWGELAECVASYLLHLKNRYGVEPALFSFNESDIGIDVLLNGEELRDLTKLLGDRFSAAGLRTMILLGDSADLKKGLEQIEPTLNDPQAMKHIGAIAYHTWNDQSAHWKAWAEVAETRGLMLMTTEMGDDPASWQDGSFNSPINTLNLIEKYLKQLRDARTQVLLEWEWTGDYSVATRANGKIELSNRGKFLRQLTQTTPTGANVIRVDSDQPTVTATAVMADDAKSAALHILNQGDDRTIRVRGLPPSLSMATLFVIDPLTGEKTPRHVEAKNGECTFDLPGGAVATLAFPQLQ